MIFSRNFKNLINYNYNGLKYLIPILHFTAQMYRFQRQNFSWRECEYAYPLLSNPTIATSGHLM